MIATRGHVSDLPVKAGSVKPEDGLAMVAETGRGAARTLGAIARALADAEGLILATDPRAVQRSRFEVSPICHRLEA